MPSAMLPIPLAAVVEADDHRPLTQRAFALVTPQPGCFAAYGALGVPLQSQLAPLHPGGVQQKQFTHQGLTQTGEQFHRFQRLNTADDPYQRGDYTVLRATEIGLAEGLGVEYYILLNKKLSKGVPADIQGIQRIEYDSPKGLSSGDLLPSVVRYLVKDHTHPKNIYSALPVDNRDKKFYFALGVLAHLRDNKRFTHEDGVRLARGTYLRKDAKDSVLDLLQSLGLVGPWGTKKGAPLLKNLFPELLKVG